jgi:hypothetical protein
VSWVALISLYGSTLLIPSDSTRGLIRLAFAVGSAAYVLFWPQRRPRSRHSGSTHRPFPVPAQAGTHGPGRGQPGQHRGHRLKSALRMPVTDTTRARREPLTTMPSRRIAE